MLWIASHFGIEHNLKMLLLPPVVVVVAVVVMEVDDGAHIVNWWICVQ